MLTIRKILFPTDFSPCAESAFAHASTLARQYKAELHILHVGIWPMMIPSYGLDTLYPAFEDGRVMDQISDAAKEQLHKHACLDTVTDLDVAEAFVTGDAAGPAILEYAAENDVDLIVMGTHGRRGIRKWMMGSVAQEVVRYAVCPVFTVNPDSIGENGLDVSRILVPVDFSEQTDPLVRVAKALAETYESAIDLLHVVAHVNLPLVYGVEAIYPAVDEVIIRSKEALDALAAGAQGPASKITTHVLSGDPAHQIASFAEQEDIDLIVLATHGFTGVERLLLGSVAEKVIRSATHPVFTVNSFGKSLLPENSSDAGAPS